MQIFVCRIPDCARASKQHRAGSVRTSGHSHCFSHQMDSQYPHALSVSGNMLLRTVYFMKIGGFLRWDNRHCRKGRAARGLPHEARPVIVMQHCWSSQSMSATKAPFWFKQRKQSSTAKFKPLFTTATTSLPRSHIQRRRINRSPKKLLDYSDPRSLR